MGCSLLTILLRHGNYAVARQRQRGHHGATTITARLSASSIDCRRNNCSCSCTSPAGRVSRRGSQQLDLNAITTITTAFLLPRTRKGYFFAPLQPRTLTTTTTTTTGAKSKIFLDGNYRHHISASHEQHEWRTIGTATTTTMVTDDDGDTNDASSEEDEEESDEEEDYDDEDNEEEKMLRQCLQGLQQEIDLLVQEYLHVTTTRHDDDDDYAKRNNKKSLSRRFRTALQKEEEEWRQRREEAPHLCNGVEEEEEELFVWEGRIANSHRISSQLQSTTLEQQQSSSPPGGILSGLALLRVMSKGEWRDIDSMLMGDTLDESENVTNDETDPSAKEEDLVDADEVVDEDDADGGYDDDLEEETLVPLLLTLRRVKAGGVILPTETYNAVLMRTALASELDHDEIVETLLKILRRMKQNASKGNHEAGPDETTYEIILHALGKRFSFSRNGSVLSLDVVKNRKLQTPFTLEAAMRICEDRGNVGLACKLLEIARNEELLLSNRSTNSALKILKSADLREEAMGILRTRLENKNLYTNKEIDSVVLNLIHWPTRSRRGQPIDTTSLLISIFEAVSEDKVYSPCSSFVWSSLIIAASRGDEGNTAMSNLVQKSFQRLFSDFPCFKPDYRLLKAGLDASQKIPYPPLAAKVISQIFGIEGRREGLTTSLAGAQGSLPIIRSSDDAHISSLTAMDVVKAMEICANARDVDSVQEIVKNLLKFHPQSIQPVMMQRILLMALKTHAMVGNAVLAEGLLSTMRRENLQPTEEAYGAVIHGLVMAKSSDKAHDMLKSMKAGTFDDGVLPKETCYNAILLDCIRRKKWVDAMAVYEEIKEAGVVPSPSSYAGLLLSSFRLGGHSKAREFVENELVPAKGALDMQVCTLSVRLLLPELVAEGSDTDNIISAMRTRLRRMGDEYPERAPNLLQLNLALRAAQLNDGRDTTSEKFQKKQQDAWQAVLMQLLQCYADDERSYLVAPPA